MSTSADSKGLAAMKKTDTPVPAKAERYPTKLLTSSGKPRKRPLQVYRHGWPVPANEGDK